jgi:hypothetical protein
MHNTKRSPDGQSHCLTGVMLPGIYVYVDYVTQAHKWSDDSPNVLTQWAGIHVMPVYAYVGITVNVNNVWSPQSAKIWRTKPIARIVSYATAVYMCMYILLIWYVYLCAHKRPDGQTYCTLLRHTYAYACACIQLSIEQKGSRSQPVRRDRMDSPIALHRSYAYITFDMYTAATTFWFISPIARIEQVHIYISLCMYMGITVEDNVWSPQSATSTD